MRETVRQVVQHANLVEVVASGAGERGCHQRQAREPRAHLVAQGRVGHAGVHPHCTAKVRGQHLLHAKGVHRDVRHRSALRITRDAPGAVRAILHHDGAGGVGHLAEAGVGLGIHDAKGVLEHHGGRALPHRQQARIKRKRARRDVAVDGRKARRHDGVHGGAAGEELRHDLATQRL